MKKFVYKAKHGPEEIVEGRIVAASAEDAVARLSEKGYTATSVEEEAEGGVGPRYNWRCLFGVRERELILFARQLTTLLKSGVPMLRALNMLSGQTTDRYFSHVISDMADKIKNGQSLSAVMMDYPRIFSSFFTAMVRSGEDSGALDKSLARVSAYYLKQSQLISKVKSAMAYPVLVLIVGILTILFVFTNVMPRILPLLLNLNTGLPLPTKILISMSTFTRNNWFWIVLGIIIFILIFKRAVNNRIFRRYISIFKLNVPVFGALIFKSELARFTRALEVSLQNGIPIINAIGISLPILNEDVISSRLRSGLKGLETGESVSTTFKNTGIFPSFALNLINVGEESGNLTEVLAEIAETFEADCADAINTMTVLLEPVMVLVIGLVVGFIVSAVLLPIFHLNITQM